MPLEIAPVDVHDEPALRAWYAVESASLAHDRPRALHRTFDALSASVRHPSPYRRVELYAAHLDGEPVGSGEVSWTLQDNLHLAEGEIHVLAGHRRRGLGRALHAALDAVRRREGRATTLAEVYATPDFTAGLAFAGALGYASVHEEEHLVLDLPVDLGHLVRPVPGYELVGWGDRCPEEHLAGFAAMRTRMEADVPVGEADYEPPVVDAERIRSSEERLARSYATIVAAARDRAGRWAGYSLLYLPHGADEVLQDDTLVMPEHRGAGLGLQLKLATLAVLQREHPDRRSLHTFTDADNAAMYLTNQRFGYRTVELMHEMQRVDPT